MPETPTTAPIAPDASMTLDDALERQVNGTPPELPGMSAAEAIETFWEHDSVGVSGWRLSPAGRQKLAEILRTLRKSFPVTEPTAQDIANATSRQEIALRQAEPWGQCLRLALGKLGPGWEPSGRHDLVEQEEEERDDHQFLDNNPLLANAGFPRKDFEEDTP